jgi:hypothetical protein
MNFWNWQKYLKWTWSHTCNYGGKSRNGRLILNCALSQNRSEERARMKRGRSINPAGIKSLVKAHVALVKRTLANGIANEACTWEQNPSQLILNQTAALAAMHGGKHRLLREDGEGTVTSHNFFSRISKWIHQQKALLMYITDQSTSKANSSWILRIEQKKFDIQKFKSTYPSQNSTISPEI